MDSIYNVYWNEGFWLPKGVTWKQLENKPDSDVYLPQASDMTWSLPIGLLIFAFRFVFESYIMTPLGYSLGVKRQKILTKDLNPILEEYSKQNGNVMKRNAMEISKDTDVSVRDVERWLRDRRVNTRPSDIRKFNECGWHFTFYLCSFTYGVVVLWNKSWLWKTILCWRGWPYQSIDQDVYWYYLIELSFYWCLVFSLITEHKRKDFIQMIVHHVATILLIYFSWALNFVRIGTLVLATHDAADFPMAIAKMMKYSGHKRLCEVFLGTFIVVWILSRLIYYPFVVLYCSSVEFYEELGEDGMPSYFFFNGLLLVLQVLHIIWTYMIARIAFQSIFKKKVNRYFMNYMNHQGKDPTTCTDASWRVKEGMITLATDCSTA